MGRAITGNAELVKKIAHFARHDALKFETTEKIGLLRLGRCEHSRFCSRQLSEDFTELPELDKGGIGVVLEIPFGQTAQPHELRVVRPQEVEIGRYPLHRSRSSCSEVLT